MILKINLPSSWNELTEKQFLKIASLFYSGTSGKIFDLKLFFILYDCRWFQFLKQAKAILILAETPLSELKNHYSFIYSENNRTRFPEKIKLKNKTFFSPFEKITNLTVDEFAVADDLHIKWRETHEIAFLQYLMAVLYVENKQPREKFDKNNLPEKMKRFVKMPLPQMLAAELAYFGCKNHITKRFSQAFPKNTSPKSKNSKKYGFGKVILQMSGGKFGSHEETKNTNIYTFLEEFNENLKNHD